MTRVHAIRNWAVFLTALFCAPGSPNAADAEGRYAVEGPGRQSCAQFGALDADSREYAITVGYASGYLGALNAHQPDTYDLTPWQTIELTIRQLQAYCAENPDALLAQALAEYVQFLAADRIASEEQLVSLQVGEDIVLVYPSTLEGVRNALADLGFGTQDEPLSGLRDYQASMGLEQSGLPDQATLALLFSPQ